MTERSVLVLGLVGMAASLAVSLTLLVATPAAGQEAAAEPERAALHGASFPFAAYDVAGRTPAFVNGSWEALYRALTR